MCARRPRPDVQEAFYHDLAGQRAGKRRVLAREEQRHREQRARQARPEERREPRVGVGDVGCPLVLSAVERCPATTRMAPLMKSANTKDTVESMVAKRMASRRPASVSA